MFKLFVDQYHKLDYPVKKYSKFDFIKRRYLSELYKIKDYYRNKEQATNNSHLLNRLITNLAPSPYIGIIEYVHNVTTNARLVSKQYDVVSNIHDGRVLDNIFFGKNSKEVLLYSESQIDFDTIENTWKYADSVRVIYTDETALDFYYPFNKKIYHIDTLHIMTIDIVMLLVQYRYWSLDRLRNDRSTNPNVFISQVVLPNMMDNMLDLAIWNRYSMLSKDMVISKFRIDHPFTVLDYSTGIDDVLKEVVKHTNDVSMPIPQILSHIPTIVSDDMLDVLFIDHRYYTKQSEWVLWLSRVQYMVTILEVLDNNGIRRNTDLLNSLPVKIKAMIRSTTIDNKLSMSAGIVSNFNMSLDYMYEILGKR